MICTSQYKPFFIYCNRYILYCYVLYELNNSFVEGEFIYGSAFDNEKNGSTISFCSKLWLTLILIRMKSRRLEHQFLILPSFYGFLWLKFCLEKVNIMTTGKKSKSFCLWLLCFVRPAIDSQACFRLFSCQSLFTIVSFLSKKWFKFKWIVCVCGDVIFKDKNTLVYLIIKEKSIKQMDWSVGDYVDFEAIRLKMLAATYFSFLSRIEQIETMLYETIFFILFLKRFCCQITIYINKTSNLYDYGCVIWVVPRNLLLLVALNKNSLRWLNKGQHRAFFYHDWLYLPRLFAD